jgi:hypothetical protein
MRGACTLKPVEAPCFRDLDLARESHGEVLVHNPVAGSEECEDVLDEVPLVVAQTLPVLHILRQVKLLCRPEARLMLLVHVPNSLVPDREDHKAPRGFGKDGLALHFGFALAGDSIFHLVAGKWLTDRENKWKAVR